MGSHGGALAEGAGAGGDQIQQAVEVERHRQPGPLLLDSIKATQQELAGSEFLFDHGERSFAGMASGCVFLLSLGGRHLRSMRFMK